MYSPMISLKFYFNFRNQNIQYTPTKTEPLRNTNQYKVTIVLDSFPYVKIKLSINHADVEM